MNPNASSSNAELSNGSSDPIPADDLLADSLAATGLRAPVDTGVGSFNDIPAAGIDDGEPLQSSHGE